MSFLGLKASSPALSIITLRPAQPCRPDLLSAPEEAALLLLVEFIEFLHDFSTTASLLLLAWRSSVSSMKDNEDFNDFAAGAAAAKTSFADRVHADYHPK